MELRDGKVVTVTTTEVDLQKYLESRKQLLAMLDAEREKVIAELETLAPKEEGKDIVETLEGIVQATKTVAPIEEEVK